MLQHEHVLPQVVEEGGVARRAVKARGPVRRLAVAEELRVSPIEIDPQGRLLAGRDPKDQRRAALLGEEQVVLAKHAQVEGLEALGDPGGFR